MSTASTANPWDTSEYLRIVRAGYDAGDLVVCFVDGTEARIDVERMPRVQARQPDWPALAFNKYEVVVPTAEGDSEISSFAIRSLTDPAFREHLEAKAAESARHVGQRIRELRQGRGLTVESLAERARVAVSTMVDIERGDHNGDLTELQRVVEAMGHSLKDLAIIEGD